MDRLSRADLEGVLAFLGEAACDDGAAAFPGRMFDGLRAMFPRTAIACSEVELAGGRGVRRETWVNWLSRGVWWDLEAWWPLRRLEPIVRKLGYSIPRPVMYGDVLTRAERRTDSYWNEVVRPAGIRDVLRVTVPAPAGWRRDFSFDSFDRTFSERDRQLLSVLRPHLARLWANARERRLVEAAAVDGAELTPRQLEVLRWAALGKTNAEIARILYLSPGTIRKHMDNVFATLGVHNRTAAVALVFAEPRDVQPKGSYTRNR
jgi:DNA-binding CsgD family transcriptional regulator